MLQFFLSSWRSGFRSRAFWGILFLGFACVAVAYLSASFSPRQPRTVALDVGLSGLRFSMVIYAITLVQELVGNEIERRSVVLSLSYPVSRGGYLFGRYMGIAALAGVAVAVFSLLLWLAVLLAFPNYEQQFPVALGWPYWVAIVGVWLDILVVAAFSLWIASISTVRMLPLALGGAFAVAGKALGAVADYLAKGAEGQVELVATYGPIVETIRYVLPDLSRLDWRLWPMYGQPPNPTEMAYGTVMAAAYIAAMLGLAVQSFSRREFS